MHSTRRQRRRQVLPPWVRKLPCLRSSAPYKGHPTVMSIFGVVQQLSELRRHSPGGCLLRTKYLCDIHSRTSATLSCSKTSKVPISCLVLAAVATRATMRRFSPTAKQRYSAADVLLPSFVPRAACVGVPSLVALRATCRVPAPSEVLAPGESRPEDLHARSWRLPLQPMRQKAGLNPVHQ